MAEKICDLIKNGGSSGVKVTTHATFSVQTGYNANVTLSPAFNNPDFVRIIFEAGTLEAMSQVIPYSVFKNGKTVRTSYNDGNAYFTDVSYVNDSTIHAQVTSMPAGAVLQVEIETWTL